MYIPTQLRATMLINCHAVVTPPNFTLKNRPRKTIESESDKAQSGFERDEEKHKKAR